jgi:hypothetical protein
MKRAELPGQADSEMISYPCMNSRCTYRHNGTGALLKSSWRFTCPECNTETLLDPDDLEYLLQAARAARPQRAATAA